MRLHCRLRRLPRRVPRERAEKRHRGVREGLPVRLARPARPIRRPCRDELIYVNSPRGFALCSMRSRTRSRYYLQVPLTEQARGLVRRCILAGAYAAARRRRARRAGHRASIEKSIAPLRSFVAEPLRFGRLFLAGDAGHIVPPTGAKGLNLAATDVKYLSSALIEHYRERSDAGIDAYSERCLRRVWRAERFSWWFTIAHAPLSRRRADRREAAGRRARLSAPLRSRRCARSPRTTSACRSTGKTVQVSRMIENPGALKVISTENGAASRCALRILTCSPASLSIS